MSTEQGWWEGQSVIPRDMCPKKGKWEHQSWGGGIDPGRKWSHIKTDVHLVIDLVAIWK